VNEEWISDKTRFVWDGLGRQRLDTPYIRENGKLRTAGWDEALAVVGEKLKGDASKIGVLAGDLQDAESMKATLDLMRSLGVQNTDCREAGSTLGESRVRESYLLNTSLADLEDADAVLLIGTDPRVEAPLVNTRLRKAWLSGDCEIGAIGEFGDLTYDVHLLGNDVDSLIKLSKQSKGFSEKLKTAERPVIIVGEAVFSHENAADILATVAALVKKYNVVKEGWNGFNVLHRAASRVGALDMGFVPGENGLDTAGILAAATSGELDTLVLLGADEHNLTGNQAFTVYIGSHGDTGAHDADVILPAAAYTEKDGIYVNMEGRVQMALPAVAPPGQAKPDWAIMRALSGHAGQTLPYNDIDTLRAKLMEDHPSFGSLDYVAGAKASNFDPAVLSASKAPKTGSESVLRSPITDFYLTNPIARASQTMAECSKQMDQVEPPLPHTLAAE